MHHKGRKVSKHLTEQNILAELAKTPGMRLVHINWKKRKIHVVDGFGNKRVVSLGI